MVVGDIETDGLLNECTKIHCAVFYNITTNEWQEFTPATVHEIPKYLESINRLCMHNGIGFDLPVLKKLYNYVYKGNYIDSLLMSRVFWPDKLAHTYLDDKGHQQKAKSAHGVENWGIEFGIAKPVHEDWSMFSDEMLHRCKEDVKIQTCLYEYIVNYYERLIQLDKRMTNKSLDNVWLMEQKVWQLVDKQANNGWSFDVEKAYECIEDLTKRIDVIDTDLCPKLPINVIKVTDAITKSFTSKGELSANALKWVGIEKRNQLAGDFCKVKFEQINLGSSDQVKDYLLSMGWKPKEYNVKKDQHNKPVRNERGKLIKTSPKKPKTAEDWQEIADNFDNPSIKLLAQRSIIQHRLSSIKGYIQNLRTDHKLEARANTCSANTTRMTHSIIVNVPKAQDDVFYGKEMRSLFTASEGKILVGCDASALEARCEAHYIYPYDQTGAKELVEGDIHSKNAGIFNVSRHVAKSGKYAVLYGCSPAKLASVLGKSKDEAQAIYDSYWQGNPGLKELKLRLEKEYDKFGYILAIDGRPLTIRYKHALINTLFQSCGSIAMKYALCFLEKSLRKYDYNLLGNFHDEIQLETLPSYADEIGELMVKSITTAGKFLKMNIELTGDYKKGVNWSLTH